MKNITAISLVLLLGATAWAQEEEDHAKGSSGVVKERPGMAAHEFGENGPAPINTNKTFGIGYGQTPGGVTGLEAEYYLSNLMLDGHLAFAFFSPDTGDSITNFAIAGGAFWRWKVYDNVAFMLGGRLDIGHFSAGGSSAGKLPQSPYSPGGNGTQFNLEFLARIQLYLGIVALHMEVGPVLAIVTGDYGAIGESWQSTPKGIYFNIPSNNLIGSIGAVIYFGD